MGGRGKGEGGRGKNPNLCHPRESNWQFPRGVPVQMNFIRVKRFCMLLKPCKGINFDHFSLLPWSRLVFFSFVHVPFAQLFNSKKNLTFNFSSQYDESRETFQLYGLILS